MMLDLGQRAPDFQLLDTVSGDSVGLASHGSARGSMVMFICNHCPFVVHILEELRNIDRDYLEKGIALFAISSNDVDNYPDDSPDKMRELAAAQG